MGMRIQPQPRPRPRPAGRRSVTGPGDGALLLANGAGCSPGAWRGPPGVGCLCAAAACLNA